MAQQLAKHRPCVLIVLDGWGIAAPTRANAITQSSTPTFDMLVARYPTTVIQASGEAAGLPWSEVGNSEVGHMSIGAGRIVLQDLSRINHAIEDESFFENTALLAAIDHVKENKSALHIIGMTSASGVHSHIEHLYALIELLIRKNVANAFIHAILDGRDTTYAGGLNYIKSLTERIATTPYKIASLSGRYFAMDRDNHWDRTEKAYRAMVQGIADARNDDPIAAIQSSYTVGVYDEEFMPTLITKDGKAVGQIHSNDAIIFFNIRADRARQITQAFSAEPFSRFEREQLSNVKVVSFTQYDASLPVDVAFPPHAVKQCLAEQLSTAGLKQLHVAETEKYAHITYFLNDGVERPFPGEDRIMIPSPSVDSYAKKPAMGADEITDVVTTAIQKDSYDFIAINFANADMVGHTGDMKATMQAVEVIDRCLKRIVDSALVKNGCVVITADHGNAEGLLDMHTGLIDKEHSNNPVPCIIVAHDLEGRTLTPHDVSSKDLYIVEPTGMLADVAPTLLALLGLAQPVEMTGKNLLDQ